MHLLCAVYYSHILYIICVVSILKSDIWCKLIHNVYAQNRSCYIVLKVHYVFTVSIQ